MCLPQVCHQHHRRCSVPAVTERTGCPGAGQRLHETICVSGSEGPLPRAAMDFGREQFCRRWIFNLHIKGSDRGCQFICAIGTQFFSSQRTRGLLITQKLFFCVINTHYHNHWVCFGGAWKRRRSAMHNLFM